MAKEPAMGQRSTASARVNGRLTGQSGNPVARYSADVSSVESPCRVRKHGVDLAGFRGEIGPCYHLAAIVAGHFVELTLELVDVRMKSLFKFAIGPDFFVDFVDGWL